jgi:hypothetical protein
MIISEVAKEHKELFDKSEAEYNQRMQSLINNEQRLKKSLESTKEALESAEAEKLKE